MSKPPQWFKDWLQNDYWHLERDVRWTKWLSLTILAVIIGTLVVRFFLG